MSHYFLSMMSATVHLLYTAPLSQTDTLEYIKDASNKGAPAEPLVWFFFGLAWHSFATIYLISRGNAQLGYYIMTTAVLLSAVFFVHYIYKASVWAPSDVAGGNPIPERLATTISLSQASPERLGTSTSLSQSSRKPERLGMYLNSSQTLSPTVRSAKQPSQSEEVDLSQLSSSDPVGVTEQNSGENPKEAVRSL
jgi:hypothetical protein